MGLERHLGLRAGQDPRGLLPDPGGIQYAIAKSLAAAPFADLLWMETKTADLADARSFAEAIHADFPDKMLAYNLSPSFNWDTTGMSDEQMRRFPRSSASWASSSTSSPTAAIRSTASRRRSSPPPCRQDGMLAAGPAAAQDPAGGVPLPDAADPGGRAASDAALWPSSGGTATTKAMGKGSTQHQHLVQTEVPDEAARGMARAVGASTTSSPSSLRAALRPHRAGSELLELGIYGADDGEKLANVIFAADQGPPRAQHPLGPRPEHLRRERCARSA